MSTSTLSDVSTVVMPMHGPGGQAKCLASGAGGHSCAAEVHSNWLLLEEHIGLGWVPRWVHHRAKDAGRTPEGHQRRSEG
jgi:hypothetical protein